MQFGEYGIKSLDAGWLTNRQIEAVRIAMTCKIKRGGKVWINVYLDVIHEEAGRDPHGLRQGFARGLVAVVKPGRVMSSWRACPSRLAREAMRSGQPAARAHEVRHARGRARMNAKELRDLKDDELVEHIKTRAATPSACASSSPPASSRTPPASASHAAIFARALTIARERRIDPDPRTR